MESYPKPNFFIVGAPKSGTTALYTYLRQHPEIYMCMLKEPQFFASDTRGHQRSVTTLSEYLDHFKDAHALAIGEASTCYLASPGAPKCIRQFCPTARIVIMLRNPIDVMYAEHSERLFDGVEHIKDFASAVNSAEPRIWRSGRFKGQRAAGLSYRELVNFSRQVARFIGVFGRSNVHIVLYDEFAKNTAAAYKEVLSFLGVSTSHDCHFNVVHANRRTRSTMIQDLLRDPPKSIQKFVHALLPTSTRQDLGRYLNRLNTKFVPRPALDSKLRQRLEVEYSQELRELSRLIDRDLSTWINHL
jgi:Sulfotransferase domain